MGYFEDEADEEYWLEQAEELGEDLDVDTREGSVYMDAAAGHCMRTAKFYSDLSMVFEMLAVDTCGGDILSEKTAMDGIIRTPATSACWSAEFDGAVPESGSEFMVGDIYLVWQSVGDEFYLVADEAGVQANQLIPGEDLIPVDNVDDLISATLGELVIPGTDEESDEALRARWREAKQGPAENGNRQHYKTWCESVRGIGRARILPLWAGENTVKAVLFSTDGINVSEDLVAQVQKYVDPIEEGFSVEVEGEKFIMGDGMGEGIANMGAHFLAMSATPVNLTVRAYIDIKAGYTIEGAKKSATEKIRGYLKALALESSENTKITVRINSIGSLIYELEEVLDYSELKINDQEKNLTIEFDSVAVLSEVVFVASE